MTISPEHEALVVDEERRVWLQRLIAAAEHALEDLSTHKDPANRALLNDLNELCEQLRAELRSG